MADSGLSRKSGDQPAEMCGAVCRRRAFEALYVAQFEASPADQAIVLDIVGQWTKMAEQLERIGRW
jgi:hypothetical protein